MVERLKQIWSGFESVTERRLTGRGVDNIAAPSRERGADAAGLPEGFTPPAEAAFAAFKAKLSAHEQRQAKRRGARAGFDAPPAPLSADADAKAAPEAVKDLIKGLKATEARVARSVSTYGGDRAQAPKRKKIFGLF